MTASHSSLWRVAALVAATLVTPWLSAQNISSSENVKGTFLGNGKAAEVRHLTVETRDPFSDKAAIYLVFSEKKPAAGKKASFEGGFGKLGSALVIAVHQDGGIFGCQVAHRGHEKMGFSSVGEIKMAEFVVDGTNVTGRITTNGERDAFGEKWDVDLTFSAPLPTGAFAPPVAKAEPAPEKKTPAPEPVPTGPRPTVASLPLPASVTGVEYKKLVEQIVAKSSASVGSVAEEFSKALKAQGWKSGPGELKGKVNTTLTRKLNGAELTIMIQPQPTGSILKIFAKGLDWSDTPASTGGATPEVSDAEKKANDLINNALKSFGN